MQPITGILNPRTMQRPLFVTEEAPRLDLPFQIYKVLSALDAFGASVIRFLMVVSPSFVDWSQLERIRRLLSIYTLFDHTSAKLKVVAAFRQVEERQKKVRKLETVIL